MGAKTSNGTSAKPASITLAQLIASLNATFPERAEVVRACVTAAVAGEHVVMFGPPGTGKSALVRALAGAFDASYFEWLMTRFTTPEEVFGPVKLSALQQDRFSRAYAHHLPGAEMAFLDEVFKANSAILNALLTVLNERKFHDDGTPIGVPLLSCFGASNELPEGPELDALYDRFLVRVVTEYISDRDAFRAMIVAPAPAAPGKINIRAEQAAARAVVLTDETVNALVELRGVARASGIVVSDRRWKQCLSLVRAAAHVDGRTSTEPDDLEILEHVLWRKPDERQVVAKTIAGTVNPSGAKAVEELDNARDVLRRLPAKGTIDATAYTTALAEATQNVSEILSRLQGMPAGRKVNAAKAEVASLKKQVVRLTMSAMGVEV